MVSLIIAFIFCILVLVLAVATFKYGGAAFDTNSDAPTLPSDTSFENERAAVQAVTQDAAQLAPTIEATLPQGVKVINIAWNPDNVRQMLKDVKRKYRNQ